MELFCLWSLILTSSDGYTRSHTVNVTVGEVRETDPLGPDTYGYYIYDSGDTEYDEAPVYDWIEIAEGLAIKSLFLMQGMEIVVIQVVLMIGHYHLILHSMAKSIIQFRSIQMVGFLLEILK